LQDACEAFQDVIGHLNIAALFEPGIPRNTYANQMRDLFSPESERSPLGKRWKIKLLWTQTSAAGFQKVGERLAALHGCSHIFLTILLSVASEAVTSTPMLNTLLVRAGALFHNSTR
jgi:hypothetical protein